MTDRSELMSSVILTVPKDAFMLLVTMISAACFWNGIMRVMEAAGIVDSLSRLLTPLFNLIMPKLKDKQALRYISMNITANIFGLGYGATPSGIKAVKRMKELNNDKDEANDEMVTFLILNTAGVTIIPTTVMAIRANLGSKNPADIILFPMIATLTASIIGLIIDYLFRKTKKMLIWFSVVIIPIFILVTISIALVKKVNGFDAFISGAREAMGLFKEVFPTLIAMVFAVSLLRSSGLIDDISDMIKDFYNSDTDLIEIVPMIFFRPISGSASITVLNSICIEYGADSFLCKTSAIIQGSTDTTLYVLSLYFSSAGIKKWGHSLKVGLIADAVGICTGIMLAVIFLSN